MDAKSYLHGIDAITGTTRTVARLSDVLRSVSPPSFRAAQSTALVPRAQQVIGSTAERMREWSGAPEDVPDSIGTLAGAVGGGLLWTDHRVLGVLGGASLGRNVPALFGAHRGMAVRNMVDTGTGIAVSLIWKSHPVWGFLLGWVVGGIVSHGDLILASFNRNRGGQ